MKILVTGGTGFLGTQVVDRLVAQGHSVRLIARTPVTRWDRRKDESRDRGGGANVEFHKGDLRERDAVRRALDNAEVLYHLAGFVSFRAEDGRKMYELHVDATRELLRDAKDAGVKRIILASTSGTIAVSKEERTGSELDDYPIATVGRWPYYLSKIYEEKLALDFCKANAIPLVVLNPSLLLGPGDDRLSSTWTVVKFLNREIPAMPNGGISFADVRDTADAFVNALTMGEVYGRHLMGVNMRTSEFFERLERLTGVPAPRVKLPSKLNVFGAHVLERIAKARGVDAGLDPMEADIGEHFFWCDSSKAERLLKLKARDAQETLYDTVQYVISKMPPDMQPGIKGRLAELRGR